MIRSLCAFRIPAVMANALRTDLYTAETLFSRLSLGEESGFWDTTFSTANLQLSLIITNGEVVNS